MAVAGTAAYLELISKNKKDKPNQKSSPGRALKQLLAWSMENQIDITSVYEKPENTSKKILEQLHLSLPHILYLSRLHLLLDSSKISDEVVSKAKQQAIDYINAVCGDFQSIQYSEIETTTNEIGLRQLPAEKNHTYWKNNK